jgi:hypothetical protein
MMVLDHSEGNFREARDSASVWSTGGRLGQGESCSLLGNMLLKVAQRWSAGRIFSQWI